MSEPGPPATPRPPGRVLLRAAGALTQLSCGACLLIGTIAIVLVQQTKVGGVLAVALWLITAMAGLVFGGLIYRGGLVSMLIAAVIDAGFGIVLIALDDETLRSLLRILPPSDIAAIGTGLGAAGFVMLGGGLVCLGALPQAMRYAEWFRSAAATRNAMSTARGFPPPPVPARTAAYIIPSEERPQSRRRLYMVLGGLAIGVGAGVGVLVSARQAASTPVPERPGAALAAPVAAPAAASPPPSPGPAAPAAPAAPAPPTRDEDPVSTPGAGSAAVATAPSAPDASRPDAPTESVDHMLAAQRAAIASADPSALARLVSTKAFAFGLDADEVAEGRDAIAAQLTRDLGESPTGNFIVESRALTIGQERGHAWIAEDLDITAPGHERRRLAITELVAAIDGQWLIVALHWATPVDDTTAERL
ncbi:MAG TPA: nuclear transport factor 2 family protein, partial [Kofleriaceae bacterium]|nr:nuclear transport factor 2 family protein [Kofleriaceae bacterium]